MRVDVLALVLKWQGVLDCLLLAGGFALGGLYKRFPRKFPIKFLHPLSRVQVIELRIFGVTPCLW